MAAAYSKEFRREVLAACDAGLGTHAAALKFGCCKSWVRRIKQERRESGKTEPKLTRNRIPAWYAYREQIEQAISRQPDLTLVELKLGLDTTLSWQTHCTALHKLKLTLKKSLEGRGTRSARRGSTARGVARLASGFAAGSAGFSR